MPRLGHCSGALQAECSFGDTFRSGRGRTITSIGSMRPRIATVRRSSRSVVMPAASAVATLTITSPAAAADASRAVMLTASPSAVKSSTVVPSPVAPTNASPVWTAVPTGMATADVMLPRAARFGQLDCGRCCCRVSRPGDSAEEEPEHRPQRLGVAPRSDFG
jgi:hypothetical protein